MNMPFHASNAINYGLGRQRRDEHIEIALRTQALSDAGEMDAGHS